jgi:hypothetical protein
MGGYSYTQPQQAVAAPYGDGLRSRLYFVGTTDARSDSNRGWMRVGSLTLSVLMKGHVGGGPVSWNLRVQGDRSNLCRSKGTRRSECFDEGPMS